MARRHWLVKSEPSTYSWDDFVAEGEDYWDGVRNYQARNFMKEMAKGDLVLFYHSVKDREVVGVARVTRTSYQDPTTDDERWVAVDLAPVTPVTEPLCLTEIKADPQLCEIPLVKQSRLSVMPLEKKAFDRILKLTKTKLPRKKASKKR